MRAVTSATVTAHPSNWAGRLVPVASIALFVSGYEHLSLYRRDYHDIPVIGVLFALNAAASAAIGAALLVRTGTLFKLAGLAVALTTLGFFGASRLPGGVFNFSERGLQPSPQGAITLVAELLTVAVIVASLIWRSPTNRPGRR